MDKKWYYAVDGVRYGPVEFDELRALALAGTIKALDLVWQPEFGPEWRNAGQVRELFEAGVPPVPPEPEGSASPDVPLVGVTGARPSCLAAAAQAFARMVTVLLRPFDITRWFSIGFCAWLAYIGTQSSINFNGTGSPDSTVLKQRIDHALDKLWTLSLGGTELAFIIGATAFGLLFAVLFCKLRSRGDFMFLHRWYRPDATISQCWWASSAAGHELFVWRLYFFLIALLLIALDTAFAYAWILKPYMAAGKAWSVALTGPAIGCVTATVLLGLVVQLVAHLAKAFVVPVMYWHGVTASRAWLVVFALCNQYPFAVLGYFACGVACATAAGFAIIAFGLLTCCIGFIPLLLPYFGVVMLLPYYLFFRGYAICFLSRWRPELIPASA